MRKLLFNVSMAAAMIAAPIASHAEVPSGNGDLFVSGSVGQSHTDVAGLTNKNDTAYGLNFGYRYNDTWGLETGYVDLGKPEANGNIDGYDYKAKLHVSGWTVGGNGKFNFAQHWFVSGRLGIFFSSTKLTESLAGSGSDQIKTNDVNWYAGVGAGYNFNRHLSLSINYDRYTAKAKTILTNTNSPHMLSGTLEYRFGV
ncbi:outer membrane protein [Dyella humicola]|uniref:outer membrane protein n=1 Tax=Dyella humicola TaxID=2992126 RepID=UPI00224DE0F9|nr:outer membrane beta-barrel protein [Dyella humicola]